MDSCQLLDQPSPTCQGRRCQLTRQGSCYLQVTVSADQPRPGLLLHWAVDDWDLPAAQLLPPGSVQCGSAVQTPFLEGRSITFTFPKVKWAWPTSPGLLTLVLGHLRRTIQTCSSDTSLLLQQQHFSSAAYVAPCCPLLPALQAVCPSKLVFVLKDGLAWINDDGSDFMVQLKSQGAAVGGLELPQG